MKKVFLKSILFFTVVVLFISFADEAKTLAGETEKAEKLNIKPIHSTGKTTKVLTDGKTHDGKDGAVMGTSVIFEEGEFLTVICEKEMSQLYIIWAPQSKYMPGEWTLEIDGETYVFGKNGFIKEFVELPKKTTKVILRFSRRVAINEIEAYGDGVLPESVQVWEPPCNRTNVLVFSTHADDEVLFLGGPLVLYGAEQKLKVQVVYLCNFTLNDFGYQVTGREYEKLDGLWEMGVRNYPVTLNFPDAYSETLKGAKKQYNAEAVVEAFVECLRRFKPLVVVTHDFNGEYGHGAHMLVAESVSKALELAASREYTGGKLDYYGVWDTPKAYFHLYEKNKIRLDLREISEANGNRTALDTMKAAYKKHVTQQQWWFYVSDDVNDKKSEKINCANFGLYRSLVGNDTGSDMLENVVPYEKQTEFAAKAAAEEAAKLYEMKKAIRESFREFGILGIYRDIAKESLVNR